MLINLLPHRMQALPPARRRWQRELVCALCLAVCMGAALGWWQQAARQAQEQQAQVHAVEQAALRQQHTTLTQDVARLSERLQHMQALQERSNQALAALQQWVPALPKGVVVQSLRQEPSSASPSSANPSPTSYPSSFPSMVLQGVAPPDDSVAQWLQHLPKSLHGELLELRSTPWPQGSGRVNVQHFKVRLHAAGG